MSSFFSAIGSRRPNLRVSNTPPTPSRSPSNTSAAGDPEDESAEESDFPDNDEADPDASSLSLSHISPALATPKTNAASPWPFNAPGSAVGPSFDSFDDEEHIPASSLPHEILLHILRLLPSTSLAPALRVCKAWCQCGVELLWHKPMFRSLPALFKMLQILSLPPAEQTFPYPDFVRRLNFNNLHSDVSDRMLQKLLPCTKIERLTLTGCKGLTPAAMVSLLSQSKRLVALDVSDVENVDDAVLETMARNCPKLQGLNMSGCVKITDRGLEGIAENCPALRRVKLRRCESITDVPIILLSLKCPLLLEVDLAGCTSITAFSVMQLLKTSHCLRELSLPSCVALTDDGFPDADNLVLSSSASADAMYDPPPSASIEDLPPNTDTLTTTSGALIPCPTPLRSPPAVRAFDQLRYLDVTSCALLTDATIAGIVKYAPKVRNLVLAKCTRLTDEALFEICKVGKHLHYLHLGHVSSLTDRSVTAIARNCTRLRYIDLACCQNLTDLSVFELAANLPRLKRIGLVRVTSITDEALYALHARTSLERIHLSYCDNLTVSGVNDMLQRLPRVTHLSLTGVTSFRKRALQYYCRPAPRDFNDHQRRSFCVFSGRGVQDLRRYLRSLTQVELAALAQPDPIGADDLPAAMAAAQAGGQQNAMAQARLQQLQTARQAIAAATARLHQGRAQLAPPNYATRGAGGTQQPLPPQWQPASGTWVIPGPQQAQVNLGPAAAFAAPPFQPQGAPRLGSQSAPPPNLPAAPPTNRSANPMNTNGPHRQGAFATAHPSVWDRDRDVDDDATVIANANGMNGNNTLGLMQQSGRRSSHGAVSDAHGHGQGGSFQIAQGGQPIPIEYVVAQYLRSAAPPPSTGTTHAAGMTSWDRSPSPMLDFSSTDAGRSSDSAPPAYSNPYVAGGSSASPVYVSRTDPSQQWQLYQQQQLQQQQQQQSGDASIVRSSSANGASSSTAAAMRPRGATVTRHNYQGRGDEDEDDDVIEGSGSEGEEEDISMD